MTEEAFRIPKTSYEELVRIVRAYGSSGQAANLDEVAATGAMDKTGISRNNAFLVSAGIVEGGKVKTITDRGRALARGLEFNVAEDVSRSWREIVIASDFLRKMLAAVSIRGGMEESALESHIVYSAGEPKSAHAMAGAGALVEIMKIARLVEERDGKIVSVGGPLEEQPQFTESKISSPKSSVLQNDSSVRIGRREINGVAITIDLQIRLNCTPEELPTLGPQIRALLESLKADTEPRRDN